VATCLNNLAVVYKLQGLFGEAQSLYRRALATLEDPIGTGPIRRRPPLSKNMASLYTIRWENPPKLGSFFSVPGKSDRNSRTL